MSVTDVIKHLVFGGWSGPSQPRCLGSESLTMIMLELQATSCSLSKKKTSRSFKKCDLTIPGQYSIYCAKMQSCFILYVNLGRAQRFAQLMTFIRQLVPGCNTIQYALKYIF